MEPEAGGGGERKFIGMRGSPGCSQSSFGHGMFWYNMVRRQDSI